ncbi:hypothetical protein, partial [Salmonella sp. s51228]|uniref:hypothetical protein n=1 Tax=Salmonella sp. s51228 TaxID=3159652 RepID=UPI00397F7FAF
MTVNARDEDDLDEAIIKDKLSKSSGSNYSFHKEKPKVIDEAAPVGSVYKKTNAKGEIGSSGRDNFWQHQEKEEKKRLETEANKSSRMRTQDEQDRKEREAEEVIQRTQVADQKF